MVRYMKEFWNRLKISEKEMLIGRSGSTKYGAREKVRSGQSYLYLKKGMQSEVIEVRFQKSVCGAFLNRAIIETLKRYPYFNTRLVEMDGDFYIVQNDVALTARKTCKLVSLGGISCNRHLIDITYYDGSVYVSFHHALCDGRGIKPFVETLIYYYCGLAYRSRDDGKGIRKAGEPLLEGETADPFMRSYEFDRTKEFLSLSREAFALPEKAEADEKTDYRYEVKIPHDRFMAVCKENNATPVILLSLLMSRGISKMYPDCLAPINANIATDMREALGADNTFKNCVKSMILPYDRAFEKLSLKEQGTAYRKILNAQRDYDYCKREANAIVGLLNQLDALNSYEEKQNAMSFLEGMALNTYVVSYLGQFILGSNAAFIESIHLYNSGTAGLGINMISGGDAFILDFKQNFASDRYVQTFSRELKALGIEHSVSDAIAFLTPEDALLKRKQ